MNIFNLIEDSVNQIREFGDKPTVMRLHPYTLDALNKEIQWMSYFQKEELKVISKLSVGGTTLKVIPDYSITVGAIHLGTEKSESSRSYFPRFNSME